MRSAGAATNLASITIAYEKDRDLGSSQRRLKVSKNRLFGKTETGGYIMDFDEKSKRIYSQGDDLDYDFGWNRDEGWVYLDDDETVFD